MSASVAPRSRRTQAERTAAANRRMIRAAIRLIARQGYTRTTLAEVGKEAGYSGGLVRYHFGSKEGLLRELVGRIASRFYGDQMQPAMAGKAGLEAMLATVDTYFDELVVREEPMRALYVLMGESLGSVPEISQIFAELNRGFRATARDLIREGMDRGEIRRELDPDAEAALALGALRGVALQWMADPGCFDLDALKASMKDAFRRHLAA